MHSWDARGLGEWLIAILPRVTFSDNPGGFFGHSASCLVATTGRLGSQLLPLEGDRAVRLSESRAVAKWGWIMLGERALRSGYWRLA